VKAKNNIQFNHLGRALALKLKYIALSYCARLGTVWFKILGY
jgi:hypothetical protein